MKPSTALFASVVAICCTINLVTGQIHFADGTNQSTAYTGQAVASVVPPGKAFTFNGPSSDGTFNTSGTVPMGQELLVLQCLISGDLDLLAHLYNVAGGGGDPILITRLRQGGEITSDHYRPGHEVYDFHNGTFVIDEGRYLELVVSGYWNQYSDPVTIFGYYRDKEPGGGGGGA